MELDRADRAFIGLFVAGGIGLFALPWCMLLGMHPGIWGGMTIGAMPLGALIVFLFGKPHHD